MDDAPNSLTIAPGSGDDGAMRWLRANSVLVLLVATVATFMAALTWQSSPLHLVASVIVSVVVVVLTRAAIAGLRAWGARPIAIGGVLALAGLALAIQVVPLVIDMGWARSVVIFVAWAGLLLAVVEPSSIVRASGGPRAEWSLLRERAALWHDVGEMTDEQRDTAADMIEARIRAMDRFRTPHTAAYIDAFQELALGDEPDEAKERLAVRFATMEGDLLRSLGATPAWDADFGDPATGSGT